MHIAQRKELDVHKTKQKRNRNKTTTSLVLDSCMRMDRREFRLKPANLVEFTLVFESHRISFFWGELIDKYKDINANSKTVFTDYAMLK